MLPLPAGWTQPSNASQTDDVLIDIPDTSWLDGPQPLSSFSVKRELVGSLLPGQVRTGSGLSVASGDCDFAYPATLGAPWLQGQQRVKPEGTASLYAQADSGATIPLGRFSVDEAGAALSLASMHLELIDEKIAQRRLNSFRGYIDENYPVDPAFIVDTIARDMGYYSTPAPVTSVVLSVPFAGSLVTDLPVRNPNTISSYPSGWGEVFGTIGPVGDTSCTYTVSPTPMASFFITATVAGQFNISLFGLSGTALTVAVDGSELVAFVSSGATGSVVRGDDPAQPKRVEIECQRLGAPGAWTGFRCRGRSSATSAWGSWVTETTASSDTDSTFYQVGLSVFDGVSVVEPGSMIGVQVSKVDDAGLWTVPNASIYPLGNTLVAASVEPDQGEWDAIQAVVAANLGAAWISPLGALIVRNFAWLRGARAVDAALEVLDDLDDLKWTVTSQDLADRVEVVYRPLDIMKSSDAGISPLIFQATEAYELEPHGHLSVVIDTPLYTVMTTFAYSANTRRDGLGTPLIFSTPVLSITQTRINSRRTRLFIRNNTGDHLFTVDPTGEPSFFVHAQTIVNQETDAIVSAGASAERALSPISINAGIQCQTAEDAERILGFVRSQTSSPRFKVESVLVPFDWRRELGDIYTLTHKGVDLDVKVLCAGMDVTGAPGDYQQHLDLVLLDQTLYDFDAAWDAHDGAATFADFNALWAGKTIEDFNLDPLKTA